VTLERGADQPRATKLRQREVRASGDQCAEAGRVGEIAAVDRGAAEVDGVEHRALQVRAGEDRTNELRPLQIGAREPGDAVQRCSAEVRVGKRGTQGRPDEGPSDELSAGEHRPAQVGAQRAAVLDAAQAGLAEVRTGEVLRLAGAGDVEPGDAVEGGPLEAHGAAARAAAANEHGVDELDAGEIAPGEVDAGEGGVLQGRSRPAHCLEGADPGIGEVDVRAGEAALPQRGGRNGPDADLGLRQVRPAPGAIVGEGRREHLGRGQIDRRTGRPGEVAAGDRGAAEVRAGQALRSGEVGVVQGGALQRGIGQVCSADAGVGEIHSREVATLAARRGQEGLEHGADLEGPGSPSDRSSIEATGVCLDSLQRSGESGIGVEEGGRPRPDLHRCGVPVDREVRAGQRGEIGGVEREHRHLSAEVALAVQRHLSFLQHQLGEVRIAGLIHPEEHQGVHVRDPRRLRGPLDRIAGVGVDEERAVVATHEEAGPRLQLDLLVAEVHDQEGVAAELVEEGDSLGVHHERRRRRWVEHGHVQRKVLGEDLRHRPPGSVPAEKLEIEQRERVDLTTGEVCDDRFDRRIAARGAEVHRRRLGPKATHSPLSGRIVGCERPPAQLRLAGVVDERGAGGAQPAHERHPVRPGDRLPIVEQRDPVGPGVELQVDAVAAGTDRHPSLPGLVVEGQLAHPGIARGDAEAVAPPVERVLRDVLHEACRAARLEVVDHHLVRQRGQPGRPGELRLVEERALGMGDPGDAGALGFLAADLRCEEHGHQRAEPADQTGSSSG